ncbi:MAG: hypothetical protein A2504_09765 [Bdellovibrionales bacterium RIFOXYD12_FULL_39_22]|nr:MAG: hypothetical protein A2385_13255 [Bdellovibrionales bacterium RIFOXYB1_FULL_39_21]OFZ41013.1 MAG: hypothetical protein A2485_16765 [Bdellovibrionales bacterium RIFOXYC12_FULL_39_17]OFZ44841.1 MAG: hypothetical protein A2404_10055 [Bdellovibrionales bacterium RIFOXYC1_FULL_39_130]OFZ74306.1 MAG: hypothetical protein A2560_17020 [Bdellovibrionales bacterium RIFOXYD1_FULL_39_84]OFZ92170.1 MAG: hypothetical protein A2504_09765 [Bdellovibrionales bacterium RIFOXYD12_FULL_39_22]HLE12725.1 al
MALTNLIKNLSLVLLLVLITYASTTNAICAENTFAHDLITGVNKTFYQLDTDSVKVRNFSHRYAIAYTKWTPDDGNDNGHVIIYNHGLQSHRGWFYETAEHLRASGFTVYAYDRIGSGESTSLVPASRYSAEIVNLKGHIHSWYVYIKTLEMMKEIAKEENPSAKIHLWGNSFGAKIVTAYIIINGDKDDLSSTIFSTPGLYRNEKSMPLPFSKLKYLFSGMDQYLPSPIYPVNGDNGAGLFTSTEPYFYKIKHDNLSLRQFTKMFYDQATKLDKFIKVHANGTSALNDNPRLYLLVENDPMMDNIQTIKHIQQNRPQAIAKYYPGGPDHRHFLSYTIDREEEMEDVVNFLLGNINALENSIELD